MPRPSHFNLDSSSNSELQELVQDLLADMATLKQIVAEQRDEIARLKGGSGRPKINPNKPSGMEQASERKTQPNKDDNRRGRGRKKLLWAAIEDQIIAVGSVREGSRFKGYEDFTVEELVIQPRVIRFRRECWVTPRMARQWWHLCRAASMAISSLNCAASY